MKKTDSDDGKHAAGLEPLIVEIATDAHGDDEQLWAFSTPIRSANPTISRQPATVRPPTRS